MTLRSFTLSLVCLALSLASAGCINAPGKPGREPEVARPEQVVSFVPLYQQNCAGCHGSNGKGGAAISLANPVYLATAGAANIKRVTSAGVAGTMMPAFSKQVGGMLTDQQIHILAQGMLEAWGHPDSIAGSTALAYQSNSAGDPARGQKAFVLFCARCHGADGAGIASGNSSGNTTHTGSLVDPAYLALASDQSLRSTIIAGLPDRGMPDWRSDLIGSGARAMTDQEIIDTVAWLASHRVDMPGQPYQKN
jgi:mono/diheme cytochrome c family protein